MKDRCAGLAGLKVLAVDDHPVNRAFLRAVLKPHVRQLRLADSGAVAIDLCAAERFGLVVLDLHMPDLDGFSTWLRIREVHSEPLPLAVALTADHREEALARARTLGFRGYVGKPVAPDALLAALHRMVDGESVFATAGTTGRSAPALLDDAGGLRALGSASRLADLRCAFAAELRDGLPGLEDEVLRADPAARERLHQWIGAAGYVGADRLAASATGLHKALQRCRPDPLSTAYLQFRRTLDATLAALAARESG
ncbi:response regulator [Wenzhouxiangella sp. XN79A]|uniref:response regulator n=1 Tax=Wenzhouxiangella sp. XN79A TaxID=2724193 RepID=UPI00144A988B|nr:response regulator [Wenzhouxiangella sp. XN79A]NKI34409.1 response regulator [Wenzhouxiangella sp. XN79A]